jgi:hypothetical protein
MKCSNYFFAMMMAFLVGVLGCEQYEYSSPYPGIIQLNLKAKYTQFDTTVSAFQLNNFSITVTSVKAIRDDGVKANIFEDYKAINRKPAAHNLLGKPAFDSSEVLGQYPLPPGNYVRFEILMEPSPIVALDGYRFISVVEPPELTNLITINKEFTVDEFRTKVITITMDLDSSLQKLAYEYLYNPHLYVSSVQTY